MDIWIKIYDSSLITLTVTHNTKSLNEGTSHYSSSSVVTIQFIWFPPPRPRFCNIPTNPLPSPPPFYWQVSAIQFSIFSLYTPFTLEAMLSPKPSTHPPPPSPPPSYKIMTDPLNQCSVKKKWKINNLPCRNFHLRFYLDLCRIYQQLPDFL